ncbi:hypothetical protein NDU88_005608 [Pleurodeles waltl]|uniref:Uncharacterized protein n=1 Tax=Pleurodeles waltl TaxID=8319 RepID=A0AAV7MWT5_PLEWA|nr:hypothetical protein NDU88_005608 [Pleurodeles waltl]
MVLPGVTLLKPTSQLATAVNDTPGEIIYIEGRGARGRWVGGYRRVRIIKDVARELRRRQRILQPHESSRSPGHASRPMHSEPSLELQIFSCPVKDAQLFKDAVHCVVS